MTKTNKHDMTPENTDPCCPECGGSGQMKVKFTLTLEEVEKDLCFSHRDMNALHRIIDGLNDFIKCGEECGERRHHITQDVFRFRNLLLAAKSIHANIEEAKRRLTATCQRCSGLGVPTTRVKGENA